MEKIWNVTEFMSEVRTRKERKEERREDGGCMVVTRLGPSSIYNVRREWEEVKKCPKIDDKQYTKFTDI